MLSVSAFVRPLVAMATPADPNASPWLSLLPFVVILGIFIIAIIAFAFDLLMRFLERRLVPWKGRM